MSADLLHAWKQAPPEDRAALRDELVRKYTPLIKLVAMRIIRKLPPQIELGDLINTGVLGLIDAIDKFDTEREIKFETYAEFRIRGAILDELRSLDWVPRSIRQRLNELEKVSGEIEAAKQRPATDDEIVGAMGITQEDYFHLVKQASGTNLVSLDELGFPSQTSSARRNFLEYFREPHQEDVIELLNLRHIREVVGKAITELPKNERFVISMYYYDELTMKEIGLVLQITESRVSQIHNKAVLRLRGKLKRVLRETP